MTSKSKALNFNRDGKPGLRILNDRLKLLYSLRKPRRIDGRFRESNIRLRDTNIRIFLEKEEKNVREKSDR